MYKIIGVDGKEYGPINLEQLREWIHQGRVSSQTFVRSETGGDWRPLSAWPELSPMVTLPPLPPPTFGNRASNKIAAGICGILLGWLGVHKFILGYNRPGLIMLLVSVLTCLWAAPVFLIIGIIEGIFYLTKSDEEFVRTYVDGRKEWF